MTKGPSAEEALRRYFLSLGYFVVRGVLFRYKSFDVTDVDLWLYQRSSLITRDRTNVDVKNKKTPQAIERIFWTRGLQQVLGLERAIVATTDKRKETKSFGLQHGVQVIDGDFLLGLPLIYSEALDRITEETLNRLLSARPIIDIDRSYAKFYSEHKELLLSSLNFNGCNTFLSAIKLLFEDYVASNKLSEATLRLIYIFISYFLITLDYSTYHLANDDQQRRNEILMEGFLYGASGWERANEIIDLALALVAADTGDGPVSEASTVVATKIGDQLGQYPVKTLANHFSKNDVSRKLFSLAKAFENYGYSLSLIELNNIEVETKAIVGVLLDFSSIDRKQVL